MKFAILTLAGMADEPMEMLDGKTPLEVAQTSNLTELAASGRVGRVRMIPKHFRPSSESALLGLMGYDPKKAFPQRGVLQAGAMEIGLGPEDIALSCRFITANAGTVVDETAGSLGSREAETLLVRLNEVFKDQGLEFHLGKDGDHVLLLHHPEHYEVWRSLDVPSPNAIVGHKLEKQIPQGKMNIFLKEVLDKAHEVLQSHEVNKVRIDLKENPANHIWLWGASPACELDAFEAKYEKQACLVSDEAWMKGLAHAAGMTFVETLQTPDFEPRDLAAATEQALSLWGTHDVVIFHLSQANKASYEGDFRKKIRWIEAFDEYVVGTAKNRLKTDARLLVTANHATPISLKVEVQTPTPLLMVGSGIETNATEDFSESSAAESDLFYSSGEQLLKDFFKV